MPLDEVARRLGVPLDEEVRQAARRFPLRFPQAYLELARLGDPADPIRRIGWPEPEEIEPDPDAIEDPVGERGRLLHPLVIRKYSDRAILLVTSRCHFYCRFCFRAGHRQEPSLGEIDAAVEALASAGGIREVILSGGDPLVLDDDTLAEILGRLARIETLATVRIHSRAPVHDPERVTPELARRLVAAAPAPLWLAVHASHPRELTPAFDRAIGEMIDAGIGLLDQTVLLAGVNADAETLSALFGGLYARRVRPYYLHHPDRVAGTARFRVTIDEGRRVYRALRGRLPGPAIPQYVLDLPDGSGKIPVDWLERQAPGLWKVTLTDGRDVIYRDISRASS